MLEIIETSTGNVDAFILYLLDRGFDLKVWFPDYERVCNREISLLTSFADTEKIVFVNFGNSSCGVFKIDTGGVKKDRTRVQIEIKNGENSLDRVDRFIEAVSLYPDISYPSSNSERAKLLVLDSLSLDKIGNQLQDSVERIKVFSTVFRLSQWVVNLNPKLSRAWNCLGVAFTKYRGDYDRAIRCYLQAVSLDRKLLRAWHNLGNRYYDKNLMYKARCCYQISSRLKAQDEIDWVLKGEALYKLGQPRKAAVCYKKAFDYNPYNNLVAKAYRSSLRNEFFNSIFCPEKNLLERERNIELNEFIDEYLNDKPKNLFDLGLLYIRNGKIADAIKCFDNIIQSDQTNFNAINNKVHCLLQVGENEQAKLLSEQVINIHPHNSIAHTNLAEACIRLNEIKKGLAHYKRAVELDPTNPEILFPKALAEDTLNLKRQAVETFRQFIAVVPDKYHKQIYYARRRLQELT
ncbi:MAG: tetratricopeptide repeat protein [candidate division Zixibacteria bacterium]|nr:tetratricopeptide repeat protein [candidate division Zixibacteria bacterium]